jgi:hypothetical protein
MFLLLIAIDVLTTHVSVAADVGARAAALHLDLQGEITWKEYGDQLVPHHDAVEQLPEPWQPSRAGLRLRVRGLVTPKSHAACASGTVTVTKMVRQ